VNISSKEALIFPTALVIWQVMWLIFLSIGKCFKKDLTVLCCHKTSNIMTSKKHQLRLSTFILFSTLIVAFCIAGRSIDSLSARPDDPMDDIRKIELQTKESFITGDSSLFVKCFTPDACIMPPNMPTLCGQQGLLQFYKGTRKAGVRDATFTSLGLFGQTPEYVTQQGAVQLFDAAQHPLTSSKVLIVWKKTDEGWRIFRQMLNFDAAMPPAPASSTK